MYDLIFVAIEFRRVILPKTNLDSVEKAPITDLKSINFVQIWHLSLNVLILEKGRIQSVYPFQSETLYWLWRCICSKAGTRVYASILSSDFRFTCHIKLVFGTHQKRSINSLWGWKYPLLLVIVQFLLFLQFYNLYDDL